MSEKFYGCASSCENLSIGFFPFRSAQLLLLVALKNGFEGSEIFSESSFKFADAFRRKVWPSTSDPKRVQ